MNDCLPLILASLLLVGWSCRNTDHDRKNADMDQASTELGPASVHLTDREMDEAGIGLSRPEVRPVPSYLECVGTVEVPPNSRASLYSPMEGLVQKVRWLEGDYVEKNTLLTSVAHPNLIRLQRQFLETKGELDYLEKSYYRKRMQVKTESPPTEDPDKIEREWKAVQARYRGLKAELQLLGINAYKLSKTKEIENSIAIRTPISGYINKVGINPGKFVTMKDLLFEVVEQGQLHIVLRVGAKHLPNIEKDQTIFVNVPEDTAIYRGRIHQIGKSIKQEPDKVLVYAYFDDSPVPILPGTYVKGLIQVEGGEALFIPKTAIIQEEAAAYVFVRKAQNTFVKIPIEAGKAHRGLVELLTAKLHQNDLVVVYGVNYINSKVLREAGPWR